MKTPKHIILLFTIACMVFVLQNCQKPCKGDNNVTEYKIDEGELKVIPYKGFESLTFVRTTTGDTHTFVGDGWKTYWGLYDAGFECPIMERYEKSNWFLEVQPFPNP